MSSHIATARPNVLQAEILRWKNSMAHRLVYVVAVYGATLTGLYLYSGMPHTWQAMLGWDNVWAVTVGPLYAVLLGTTITAMDLHNRGAGTTWRCVPQPLARGARIVVLVLHIIAANALALIVPLLGCQLGGFAGPAPWAQVLTLSLICGLSQSALAVMATVLTRLITPAAALLAGSVFAMSWMVLDTVEDPTWRLWPANWLVRGTIPLTGTHTNGVALSANDPLWSTSIWEPALMSLALAAVLASFEPRPLGDLMRRLRAVRPAGRHATTPQTTQASPVTPVSITAPSDAANAQPCAATSDKGHLAALPLRSHRSTQTAHVSTPRPASALLAIVSRTTVPWIPVAILAFGMLLLRWRPATDVALLEATVLVPLSASVLPIAMWSTLSPGWRSIGTRPTRFTRPARIATLAAIAWSSVLIGIAMAFLATQGVNPGKAARGWLCCTIATTLITALMSWMTLRFGTGVAGAISVFGIIFGTLVGATGLLATLWPFVPWAWGALYSPLPIAASLVIAAVSAPVLTHLAGRSSIRACTAE